MILCDRHSKTCAALLLSFIAIALIIGLLIPIYRGLVCLFGLTILTNTFIPNVPHEPVMIIFGGIYPPWLVAICAGVAVLVIEIVNYHILTLILDSRKIRGFREKQFYQRAEHCFSKSPSLSLVAACLAPVPFIPLRILAVTNRYSIRKYALSVFIGRVPRFYLLALIGNLPFWIYLIIFVIAFSVILTKRLT